MLLANIYRQLELDRFSSFWFSFNFIPIICLQLAEPTHLFFYCLLLSMTILTTELDIAILTKTFEDSSSSIQSFSSLS